MDRHGSAAWGLVVLAAAGCSDSSLVNKVADQAATIATLRVELQTCSDANEAACQERDSARAELAAANDALGVAQNKLAESGALQKALASQLGTAQKQLKDMEGELLLAQAQLRKIETEEQNRLEVVGEWRSELNAGGSQFACVLVFNPNGTGLYRFLSVPNGPKELDACQFRYEKSGELGDYLLKPYRPQFDDGMIRIDPDGKTSYLFGFDAKKTVGSGAWSESLRGEREFTRTNPDEPQ